MRRVGLLLLAGWLPVSMASVTGFEEYRIGEGYFALPIAHVEAWAGAVTRVGEHLVACAPVKTDAMNPVIKRRSSWEVNPASNGCRFTMLREQQWHYDCILPKRESMALGHAMQASASDQKALGDLTEDEQSILFNSRFCRASKK
jgi:hypothetical protein